MADRSNYALNVVIERFIEQRDGTILGYEVRNMYENGTGYEYICEKIGVDYKDYNGGTLMEENIYNVKKIGDIEVKITDDEVLFFNKGKKVFFLCPFRLRMQELSGIIRDSLKYYGLDAAEEFSAIAGWIKVNT